MSTGRDRLHFGITSGIVVDNKHPEGHYKVKLKFEWIRSTAAGDKEDFISNWARVATQMGGGGRGIVCLPEPDDEVFVVFEKGSLRYPVVIGSAWNKTDMPPQGGGGPAECNDPDPDGGSLGIADVAVDNNASGGKNDARFWMTRHGHALIFDDGANPKVIIKTANGHTFALNEAAERISLFNSNGEQYLILDEAASKITICSANGDIDVLCENGTFTLKAKDIDILASATSKYEAGSTAETKSGSTMKIEAGSTMTQKAPLIKLN